MVLMQYFNLYLVDLDEDKIQKTNEDQSASYNLPYTQRYVPNMFWLLAFFSPLQPFFKNILKYVNFYVFIF